MVPPRDSSTSKVYMTTRNYGGPSLHQKIRGRSEQQHSSPPPPRAAANTSKSNVIDIDSDDDVFGPPHSSDNEDVEDFMKPPMSSDEESTGSNKRSNLSSKAKRKASDKDDVDDADDISPPSKRTKPAAKPTRVSKRNTGKQPTEPKPEAQPPYTASFSDISELFPSQSSQTRRKAPRAKYGRANSYNLPSSQGTNFADPGDLPGTPRISPDKTFTKLDATPRSRKRNTNQKLKDMSSPAVKPDKMAIAFKMPDEFDLQVSSTASMGPSNILANDSSPFTRHRSGSTSSLSSIDSLASAQLTQDQKTNLQNGTPQRPLPPNSIRCPLCHTIVSLTSSSSDPNPATLPLRAQQAWCHTHRLHDAQTTWQKSNYPQIHWTNLETHRIPTHLPHLRRVLTRETPSFYLNSLEKAISKARGNQSKLRKYLAEEVVEVVKPGYYGPRGAKIMGQQITTEMAADLKRALRGDKIVRAVGVSAFVSTVLLPELLLAIVREDMGLGDGEDDEARRVVSESTDVGMLLWPDDDHVERDDDEEE